MPESTQPARILVLAALLTFGPGLTATGLMAQQGSRSPASSDACGLLTQQDAAAALGEAATGPTFTPNVNDRGTIASACEYTGSGYHKISVELWRLSASAAPMYRGICAGQKQDGLAGLGEVACWYQDKHEELHVIKGTAFLSIELRRSGNPTEPIKALMKKALAKLK